MRAILFRKVVVDGVNYFQLFKDDYNFNQDPMYADYDNRDKKDFFYISLEDDFEVPHAALLNIYYDDNGKLKVLEDRDLYNKVFEALKKKYHLIIREVKPIDTVVDKVKEKILYQDKSIRNLASHIYLNRAIVTSNLPMELKLSQKNNILFYGPSGSGKKTIIETMEKELGIPFVDVTASTEVKETIETIITKLFDQAETEEEASYGVVFIRDNFEELSGVLGNNLFSIIDYITSQGVINYHGRMIDFRTLTFVVLFDADQEIISSNEDIRSVQNMTNCAVGIGTRTLTNGEKYKVLFSKNGRLKHYEEFLNQFGKKLVVDDQYLLEIICDCNKVNPSMNVLNGIIDGIMAINRIITDKDGNIEDIRIDDVHIDKDCSDKVKEMLSSFIEKEEEKHVLNENKNFNFEQRVDEIVNKVKEDVVGQDRCVKMLVYQLINNLIWANKEDVDDPKKYIKNILVRGNTGTGKTFIESKVLKNLGVPYFIADATEYTEAGYVGKDVEDMLVALYHAAGDDLEKAQRGVLVIDEIDKRASKVGGNARDVGGSGVQEALYKFAEGTIIKINIGNRMNEVPMYFDTSRLSIICSGAFEDIEQIRDERIGKKKAGFGAQDEKGSEAEIIDEDYISYGMKPQFMRRVKNVITLNDVSKEQFINIMKKSNSSALKVQQATLKDIGIDLEYTEDFYESLADKAISMKQGVTGIEKALVKILQAINIQDIRPSEIEKIILNGESVNDPNKVILVPREIKKVKRK